jgi:hypothetical protein
MLEGEGRALSRLHVHAIDAERVPPDIGRVDHHVGIEVETERDRALAEIVAGAEGEVRARACARRLWHFHPAARIRGAKPKRRGLARIGFPRDSWPAALIVGEIAGARLAVQRRDFTRAHIDAVQLGRRTVARSGTANIPRDLDQQMIAVAGSEAANNGWRHTRPRRGFAGIFVRTQILKRLRIDEFARVLPIGVHRHHGCDHGRLKRGRRGVDEWFHHRLNVGGTQPRLPDGRRQNFDRRSKDQPVATGPLKVAQPRALLFIRVQNRPILVGEDARGVRAQLEILHDNHELGARVLRVGQIFSVGGKRHPLTDRRPEHQVDALFGNGLARRREGRERAHAREQG